MNASKTKSAPTKSTSKVNGAAKPLSRAKVTKPLAGKTNRLAKTTSAAKASITDIRVENPKGLYKESGYSLCESLGYLVKRTSVMLSSAIDQELAPYDLTHPQFAILVILSELQCQTAADLARETCGDTGAITRMLDRLEAKGLVKRVRSVTDRRVVNIELTADGTLCAQKMPIVAINVLNRHLDGFNKQELATMKKFLWRLLDNGGVRIPGTADKS